MNAISLHNIQLKPGVQELLAPIPIDEQAGIKAFISLTAAGDMSFQKRELLSDRKNLFQHTGINPDRVFAVCQEHTKTVGRVEAGDQPADFELVTADGLVSHKQAVVLSVTVADCLPIFIYDKQNGAFGIVHSGWKGTGIVLDAVAYLESAFQSEKAQLKVVIGPGIGACCYDVSRERYDLFRESFGDDGVLCTGGKHYLDLKAANRALLQAAGIEDITIVEDCTVCTPAFHSFRRQGAAFKRMLACIGYFA